MRTRQFKQISSRSAIGRVFYFAAAGAMLLGFTPAGRAQSVDFSPAALSKQRAAIILRATHTPVADLENDVNHLAVLSESCRVESGAKACGLSDKSLESTTLEDRFAYYVRKPTDAQAGGRQAKVDRHNWEVSAPASH